MNCPVRNGSPEVLLNYCSRKRSAESVLVLEKHMENCPECRHLASGQQQVWAAMDSWEAESVAEDFDDRLYLKIRNSGQKSWWISFGSDRFAWKPALPFAGAALTAAFAVFLVMPDDRTSSVPAPSRESTRLDTLEPEQVERTLEDLEMLKQLSTAGSGNSQAL